MKELTKKQKAARQLVSDYTRFLIDQEALVSKLVEKKWAEMTPLLEEIIDHRVKACLAHEKRPSTNKKIPSTNKP